MAGKRLLDAAKILEAAGSVGKQHFVLRRQQWDVYSKTSSLAKAVKDQTDRVTVTAKAALELARRLDETGPAWQRAGQEAEQSHTKDTAQHERRDDSVREEWRQQSGGTSQGQHDAPIIPNQEVAFTEPHSIDGIKTALREDDSQQMYEHMVTTHAAQSGSKSHAQSLHPIEAAQEDLPQGASLDGIFWSRNVARTIGSSNPYSAQSFDGRKKLPPSPLREMVAAERDRQQESAGTLASSQAAELKTEQNDATSPNKSSEAPEVQPKSKDNDAEMQNLGESIARDSAVQSEQANDPEKPYEMHESRVPSSRFGRLWQYGGLATSMAFGAVGGSFRRFAGGSSEGSLMMSEANINRLVAKLSRMRGAALKLGQMISFQDSKVLPPAINTVLQRVQDSADYMPPSQRDKVLRENLGGNWRELFSHFEEKPFAAASIGQVHKATLASNGKDVAVKVQYPGVRNSIDSDLNNLSMLLTASRLLPKGLFLNKTIDNARVELGWECDYEREAQACTRFKELLKDERDTFTVPEIFREACGPGVLTAEFVHGSAVTKLKDLSQDDRDWVGTQILRLCLRELMEWRFMQTDPNWTNFLYNRKSKKLELLDFGASREFPDKFVEPYVALLIAASKGEREQCRQLSVDLGYLTGEEGKEMVKAHVDSIMTLAEPFVESAPEVYDFEDQTITDRVRANIGVMLRERLAPPPEETYSLHRKLSGSFLLCARLRSRVRARDMFANAVRVWDGREGKIVHPPSQ